MAVRNFDSIFYRVAATPVSSVTKTGAGATLAITNWTKLVGLPTKDGVKIGIEADGQTELGGGQTYTGSEKGMAEIHAIGFSAANFATLRSALLNVKVDLLFIDSEQDSVGLAVWNTIVYPAADFQSGEQPTLKIGGECKRGTGAANTPFTHVTVSV